MTDIGGRTATAAPLMDRRRRTDNDPRRNGYAGPRVSVVIPTLNEAENLPYVFARLPPICTR